LRCGTPSFAGSGFRSEDFLNRTCKAGRAGNGRVSLCGKVAGMSDLLSRNVLVINQKAKLIELTDEYRIRDEEGNDIGSIREEGQSVVKKAVRLVSDLDQFLTHRLAVYDRDGTKVVELLRPRKIMKSRVEITDGQGLPVGTIVQKNVLGKKRFALESTTGELLGAINAENWRAWDFAIEDQTGAEVGRITKKWAGLLKEGFTTADNYVLEISGQVSRELRLMMLGSAAGVDLALKQDSR
jgi:uncharacterized protein YxjI